jgi:hypothetical protein
LISLFGLLDIKNIIHITYKMSSYHLLNKEIFFKKYVKTKATEDMAPYVLMAGGGPQGWPARVGFKAPHGAPGPKGNKTLQKSSSVPSEDNTNKA